MAEPRDAAELMRAYYDSLDTANLDAFNTLFGPESVWEFPGARLVGGELIRRRMAGSIATGVRMTHAISHMLERDGVAICELEATNVLGEQTFLVKGAVVCEARDGRIARICAYPDAADFAPFIAALAAARKPSARAT